MDTLFHFQWGRADLERSPDWFFYTHYMNCIGVWFRAVGKEWLDFKSEKGTDTINY